MLKQLLKRISNIPSHKAIIAGLVAIIGVLTTLLIIKHTEIPVEAFSIPRAARLERVDGSVDMMHSLNTNGDTQEDWAAATTNAPITVGDRVYARSNSRAAIALTGRNSTRLDSNALVDVISLDDHQTQLALRSGSATFDVGDLANGELFEVATPNGAVDFLEAGLYQLSIGDDGNTTVSVLRGLAQVVGLAGTGQIRPGQVLTLTGATDEQASLSSLAPDLAGDIVDDYYSYRYPDNYDGRYKSYNTYIDDPNYYDPYSHSASYSYLSEDVPGLYDLDRYGDWEDVSDYGRCWAPRGVSADWSPYSDGYWDVNDFWGPTWVSAEPWGYAPYHYGRWTCLNNQRWVWVPEGVVTRPVYAPALVAFIPLQQTNQIAWVPLAPGERYAPRCYDANFQPRYLDRQGVVVQQTYVNVNYPTAVTAVDVREFRHRIDRRDIGRVDAQLLAQSRPVLDPFAVEGMREMARRGDTDRRVKLPREVRREIFNRQVVTSVSPRALPVQTDIRKAFQVEPVTDKQRKNKLKIDESGQVANVRRPDRAPMPAPVITPAIKQEREQKMTALTARAQKGDQEARQELRQMKREQRKEDRALRNQSGGQPQTAQQQTPAQQAATHREQLHQQMQQEQQQRATAEKTQREQMREQRKVQRQAQQQQQAATQQQQIEQRKQVEQARQARAQQDAARQAQVNQQREQNKAQRQAARQQQQPQRQQQGQKQQQVMEQQRQQAAAQQAARQGQANQERAARRAQQQQQMEQQRRQQVINQQQQQQQQRQQRQQQREQQRVQPPPVQPRKPPIVMQQTEKNRVVREPQQQRPPRIQQTQPPVVAPQPKQRPPAMGNPSTAPRQMDNAPRGEKRRKP